MGGGDLRPGESEGEEQKPTLGYSCCHREPAAFSVAIAAFTALLIPSLSPHSYGSKYCTKLNPISKVVSEISFTLSTHGSFQRHNDDNLASRWIQ